MSDEAEEFELSGEVPDPLHRAYEELIGKVGAFPELGMQAAAVRELMEGLKAQEVVWCLDQLLRAALLGQRNSLEAILAMAWWLIEMRVADDYERIKELFITAHHEGREAVVDMFRDVPPHRELAEGRRLPEVRLPLTREVTLGERRTLASGPNRRILERLLMDPSPLVIGKLLDNPQIQLRDIQVIASRRPTKPELLRILVCHRKWYGRQDVRDAVVRNPFNDTGLSLKLLPTLRLKSLRDIAYSSDLHPLVHESARRLVRLREERTAPWRV